MCTLSMSKVICTMQILYFEVTSTVPTSFTYPHHLQYVYRYCEKLKAQIN